MKENEDTHFQNLRGKAKGIFTAKFVGVWCLYEKRRCSSAGRVLT